MIKKYPIKAELALVNRIQLKQSIRSCGGRPFEMGGVITAKFDSAVELEFKKIGKSYTVSAMIDLSKTNERNLTILTNIHLREIQIEYNRRNFSVSVAHSDIETRLKLGYSKSF